MSFAADTMSRSLRLGIIADDLTGAMDSGLAPALAGLDTVVSIASDCAPDHEVVVVNTDSRRAEAQVACARVAAAARQLAGSRLYKKIDSTLRGHVGAELSTLLRALRAEKAVLCPAFIEGGRALQDGQLYVHGVPLDQTAFAADPTWPMHSSDVVALLGLPATLIRLHRVEEGHDSLRQAIRSAETRLVVVDAVHTSHLDTIAEAIVDDAWLPCGSAGLASAWLKVLWGEPGFVPRRPPANPAPVLIVAGSRNAVTGRQMRRAQSDLGLATIEIAPGDRWSDHWEALKRAFFLRQSLLITPAFAPLAAAAGPALNAEVGALAARACQVYEPAGVVLTGGDTALAVCHALGAQTLQIVGQLQPGIPYGLLRRRAGAALWSVTKAGGFGDEYALVEAVALLQGGQRDRAPA